MFVQPWPIYIQRMTAQWPYSKSSYVMTSQEPFIDCSRSTKRPHKEIRSFSS